MQMAALRFATGGDENLALVHGGFGRTIQSRKFCFFCVVAAEVFKGRRTDRQEPQWPSGNHLRVEGLFASPWVVAP